MCLSEPYRVVDVPDPLTAVVTRGGVQTTVTLLAADADIAAGDWVLVHSGIVLTRLSDADVDEIEQLTRDGGRS